MESPRTLGVPHDKWRPSQYAAFKNVENVHLNGGGFVVQELPTGVGKSSIATALGSIDNVTVLVQTLGLLDQYEELYGFDIIKGRQEYRCVLPIKINNWRDKYGVLPTAANCHLSPMNNCSVADKCPYLIAKEKALSSNRLACTYKYASMSSSIKGRSGILVLDEAHESVEEMISNTEFKITWESICKFDLPRISFSEFPEEGDLLNRTLKVKLMQFMAKSMAKTSDIPAYEMMTKEGSELRKINNHMKSGFSMLSEHEFIFVKHEKPSGFFGYQKKEDSIILKPITAKRMAKEMFESKKTVLLMSATIGNPKPLAEQLGIELYSFNSFPHPVPKSNRPIYNLGVAKMTKINITKNPMLQKIQAIMINNFVGQLDERWRGIVLTTSYAKVGVLREELSRLMPKRIYIPSRKQMPLSQRIAEFIENQQEGLIIVDTIQGWGTGVDLRGDLARFSIIAGVPFPNPSDKYDVIRMQQDGGRRYAMWNSYNKVPQAAGRVSRGEKDNGSWVTNVAAIADGLATDPQALASYPLWFKSAIV